MKISTRNGVVRKVATPQRGWTVYEEKDSTLWLVDKSGYAIRVEGLGLTGELIL